MKVLGLDISEKSTGWAVLTDRLTLVDYGALSFLTAKSKKEIFLLFASSLATIVAKHKTFDYIIIEDTFFSKNISTLKALSNLAGIAILTAYSQDPGAKIALITVASLRAALWPKQKVDKEQVFRYISNKYNLKNIPNDVTDAITAASFPFVRKVEEKWTR